MPAVAAWAVSIIPLFALAQPLPAVAQTGEGPAAPSASNPGGPWPSDKMIELFFARWADEAAYRYDLDDAQRSKAADATRSRWTTFLAERRAKLQPLITEFIEMRLELHPPSKERVRDWAARARPIFDQFRAQIDDSVAEFRDILRPSQRAKFELEVLQFRAGLALADRRLTQLGSGTLADEDLKGFWRPTRRVREARRDRKGASSASQDPGGAATPVNQVALELARWERFVEVFAADHHLDEAQRDAARSCLAELKQRAVAHADLNRSEIDDLEARIARFDGSEKELAALKERLTELYGPIDEMFRELQRRIEQLPTAPQRAAAAKVKTQAQAKSGATDDVEDHRE